MNTSIDRKMIEIPRLNDFHVEATKDWHVRMDLVSLDQFWDAIRDNHLQNFMLWHEEDIARRDDLPAQRIKESKRKIDKFNQNRNNAMERIDDWILSQLVNVKKSSGMRYHSETPGMMIDRLSIMALKIYHMQEQVDRSNATPEHRVRCSTRVAVLAEQIADLSGSLAILISELVCGKRGFKVYRQFKMYNDPATNPELYGVAIGHGE